MIVHVNINMDLGTKAMIKLLTLFLICSLVIISVLAYRDRYSYAVNLIMFCILVFSFCGGCWFTSTTSLKLMPFFAFGIKETLQEDIKVVRTSHRRVYFSNEQSYYTPDHLIIGVYYMISFLFSGGVIMLSMRYVTLFLTNKFSSQLYDCLLSKWPTGGHT